jgi:peptidoglycan hydrolase-like protein with peptidoglycan-binding domain
MKKLLTLTLLFLCVFTTAVMAQNETASPSNQTTKQTKRGPVFRATKEQINQAQALLKSRGFYAGEQIGKLDDATREGLRKYQQAEGLKVTGTLNKITLEKMNIALTDKQKTM